MTEGKTPKLVEEIKTAILGEDYDLSFAFISKARIKEINRNYRAKDEPTDILSFELSKKSGEILICKEIAKLKSKNFNMQPQEYLIFLVIHGILHLKGLKHGAKMSAYELSHYRRFRRRHL